MTLPRHGAAAPWRKAAAAAVALAAAVRLAYFLGFLRSPLFGVYALDRLYYRTWALRIAGGDWIGQGPFEQGPLYAYLLGGAYRLLGGRDELVLPLQLLLGVATVLLVRSCARRAWGERGGAAAALVAAAYGPFVFHECMVMKSFLEPLLVTAALAAALRGVEEGRARWHALAGAAVGLSCLVREVHVLLLAPLLWSAARGSAPGPGAASAAAPAPLRRLVPAGALLLAFLLALAPAAVRNGAVSGEFVASTSGGGELLYLSWGPQNRTGFYSAPDFVRALPFVEHHDFREEAFFRTRTPMTRRGFSHYWYRETAAEVARSPGRVPELAFRKGVTLLQDTEIPDGEDYRVTGEILPLLALLPSFGWVAGLGLLGLVLAPGRGDKGRLLALFALVLAGEVLLTYHFARFRLALAASWIVLAGGGAAWLLSADRIRDRRSAFRLGAAAALVAAATALSFLPPLGSGSYLPAQREEYRRIVPLAAERRRDALVLLGRLRQVGGGTGDVLALGRAFEDAGLYPEAVGAYGEAVRAGGRDGGEGRRALAELLDRMGEFDEAARQAELLVRERPDGGEGYLLLGTALSRLGATTADPASSAALLARAEEALRKAVALSPGSGEAHHRLGRVLRFRGDDAGALRALDRALELSPGLPGAARDRARILEGEGAVSGT